MNEENLKKQIFESVYNANEKYLNNVLKQVGEEKKDFVKSSFNNHMKIISDFCFEEIFVKNNFSQKFIRELHKIHYPKGYTETVIKNGLEIVGMIPGVYRSNENYMWVNASEVKNEMEILIENLGEYNKLNFEQISTFLLNYFRIHPFGNGNGRISSILFDLLLLKNNLKLFFYGRKIRDKEIEKDIFSAIIKSLEKNDNSHFINTIKRYYI